MKVATPTCSDTRTCVLICENTLACRLLRLVTPCDPIATHTAIGWMPADPAIAQVGDDAVGLHWHTPAPNHRYPIDGGSSLFGGFYYYPCRSVGECAPTF